MEVISWQVQPSDKARSERKPSSEMVGSTSIEKPASLPATIPAPGISFRYPLPAGRSGRLHRNSRRPYHRADEAGQRRTCGTVYKNRLRRLTADKGKLKGNTKRANKNPEHSTPQNRIQINEKSRIQKDFCSFLWRCHPDLNRGMKVLQTFALPLGYGTV